MKYCTPLPQNIYQLKLIGLDSPYRTSGYIIREEKTAIIETGSAVANDALMAGLKELEIKPEQIDYVIVTHIHLDHAGGAGLLMSQCPNATFLVHKRGKQHMSDPSKLIAGAKQVYREKFNQLFHPILPITEDRIQIMDEGDELDLGHQRKLKFFNTPGHAFHHLAIFDRLSNGLFSGDSAGIFFRSIFDQFGISFCLPVTAPTQFVPDIMDTTLTRLQSMQPERLYFTHFGMSNSATELLQQAKKWTSFFGNDCVSHYRKNRSFKSLVSYIHEKILVELRDLGVTGDFMEADSLIYDVKLNARGIIDYVEKQDKNETK